MFWFEMKHCHRVRGDYGNTEEIGDQQDNIAEKAMATHSSTLAWKIPWMGEPGSLWYVGSQTVGHD